MSGGKVLLCPQAFPVIWWTLQGLEPLIWQTDAVTNITEKWGLHFQEVTEHPQMGLQGVLTVLDSSAISSPPATQALWKRTTGKLG